MQTIELYTRPGCPFCFTLRRRLRKHSIQFREVNIWNDAEARDQVRSVGGGNETVPTVHIGDRWLINPTANDVARELRRITNVTGTAEIGVAAHRHNEPGRHDRPLQEFPASLAIPRTTAKEIPEPRHHVLELTHAARDIRIYRTTVVACGTPGVVVAIQAKSGRDTYTVEFQPTGFAGATIRVAALTEADLQGRGQPRGSHSTVNTPL